MGVAPVEEWNADVSPEWNSDLTLPSAGWVWSPVEGVGLSIPESGLRTGRLEWGVGVYAGMDWGLRMCGMDWGLGICGKELGFGVFAGMEFGLGINGMELGFGVCA